MNEPSALTLLRLQPDMALLAGWALGTGQRALREDTGYAVHGALKAVMGDLAPQPFVVRQRGATSELLGYTATASETLRRALQLAPADRRAADALRLTAMELRPMPSDWRRGERFSFEVRVAPVVRSRSARPGAVVEVDAAWHESLAGSRPGDRQQAYGQWLARELGRDDAAALRAWGLHAFSLIRIARCAQRTVDEGSTRAMAQGMLPDLTARGELVIGDPAAFVRLLARGLGRHRAFGFGCLLLAPAGVLHPGR